MATRREVSGRIDCIPMWQRRAAPNARRVSNFVFRISPFSAKRLGMHFMRELLDRIHQPGRRPNRLLAQIHHVAPLDRIEIAPHGPRAQAGQLGCRRIAVASGEDDVLRLQPHHLFETQLRPILIGVHNRFGAGPAQRIRDERLLPNRDQRVLRDHEEHVRHRPVRRAARAAHRAAPASRATTASPCGPAPIRPPSSPSNRAFRAWSACRRPWCKRRCRAAQAHRLSPRD